MDPLAGRPLPPPLPPLPPSAKRDRQRLGLTRKQYRRFLTVSEEPSKARPAGTYRAARRNLSCGA